MKHSVFRIFFLTVMTVFCAAGTAADVAFLHSTDFGSGVLAEPVAASVTDLDRDSDLDIVVVNRAGEDVTVFLNNGFGDFSSSSTYAVGTSPEAVAVADVDNDDYDDVVVCNGGDGTVQVLLGDGSGGLVAAGTFSVGTAPASVTPCYLNEDDTVDLAVVGADSDSGGWKIWMFEGSGDGTFAEQRSELVGPHPVSIQAFNMDGDAFTDFVWANRDEDMITVLTDSFVPASYETGDKPRSVCVEDMNGDGYADILVLCEDDARIDVFEGSETGEFTVAESVEDIGIPHAMAVADLDGSSPPDLVVLDDAGSALRVLYGDLSAGYSATAGPAYSCANSPTTVVVDMFDNDSFPDAVVFDGERSVGSFYSGMSGASFLAARSYDVGWSPADVAVAQVGTDTDVDIVVSNEDDDSLSLLHGRGDGTFGPIDETMAEFAPSKLASGRFDGTNGMDISVTNRYGNSITIFLSQSDGTLSITDSIESSEPIDIETGDLDGDGDMDIVVLERADSLIRTLSGSGTGGFVVGGTFDVGDAPFGLAIGLFDADDVMDAAVTYDVEGKVAVLSGTGDGGFGSPTVIAEIDNATCVETGFFDADAHLDLAVTDFGAGAVTILSATGDGTFTAGSPISVGTGPSDVVAVDADVDRNTDLLVSNRTSNDVHVLSGDGAGGFSMSKTMYPGRAPNAVAASDMDGDGVPDATVVNFESNTVVVYINITEFTNTSPTANAGGDDTVTAGDTVQLDGSGSSDGDGDSLTYAWTQTVGPGVVLDDSAVDMPQFMAPEVAVPTSIEFELVVSDPFGLTDSDTVALTVGPAPNVPPVADAGIDQSVDELVLVTLNGSDSGDSDGDELAYDWTQLSGPAVTLSGRHTPMPTFYSPQVFESIELVFQLIVNDGTDVSPADTITVTVRNTQNESPTAVTDGDQTVSGGETVSMNGSASSDPNGDPLAYLWRQTFGAGVTLSGGDTDTAQFEAPDVTVSTVLKFQLLVGDGETWSAPDSVNVTVIPAAVDRPTANAGTDQTVDELDVVSLDGSGSSDPNGDLLTYSWTQTSGPSVVMSDPTGVQPTFVVPNVLTDTSMTFSLVVADGTASSVPDTVTVTVLNSVNEPPTADAGANQSAGEGTTVWLDGSGSADRNDDTMTYEWQQTVGPAVLLTSASSESASFKAPDVAADTDITFALTVSDGLGGEDVDTVTVTVLDASSDRPVADAGTDMSANEAVDVVLDGRASSGPDGDTLTFFWTQVGGPPVSLDDAVTSQPKFTAPSVVADTALEFSLQVSSGDEMSLADTVRITVLNSVNEPPVADAGPDVAVGERNLVSLDGIGSSDPNGESLTFGWAQISPPNPVMELSDPAVVAPLFTAPEVESDTEFEFQLTVSDGVDEADDIIRVTVLADDDGRPIALAGADVTVHELTSVALDGSASYDPGGGDLTFAWSQISGPDVTLSNDLSAAPSFDVPRVTGRQKIEFSLTVFENGLASAPDTVSITVCNSVNELPVADPDGDQIVSAGDGVRLDGTGSSDPNGESLTFQWTQISPADPVIKLSDSTVVAPLFTAPEVESDIEFEFQLTVYDGTDYDDAVVRVTVMSATGGSTGPTDINSDGKVNAIDVQKVINQVLGIEPGPGDAIADANDDGKVDAIDIQMVINKALGIT